MKGYSKFNNDLFYNTELSSERVVAPFSGFMNHCRHWKVWELVFGDLIKENIFHSHWLSLSEMNMKQEWEKQEALIWEAKQKLAE